MSPPGITVGTITRSIAVTVASSTITLIISFTMTRYFVAAAAVALAVLVTLIFIQVWILGAVFPKVLVIWFPAPVLVAVIVIVVCRGAFAIFVSTASLLIDVDLDF